MSFCHNTNQQMTIFDPFYGLTERELKFLHKSWAEIFSSKIFPLINEDRFAVLYSDNPATRPNNPVNVYLGLIMLREVFTQSDEEALSSLMFDVRYQYALHTTSFKEQPVSKNSLSNFRAAVCKYNEEHGVDLIQEEIESHAKEFSTLLNIDGRMIRMDSLMISSSCKKLSRLEIVYSCIERLIKKISDINKAMLPEKYNIYLQEEHQNDVIYRSKDNALDERLNTLIEEARELYNIFIGTDVSKTEEFEILSRMLGEQSSEVDGVLVVTPSNEILPVSLQNPTDQDATYRRKGPKGHNGYVGNVVESFDEDNAIIMQYDLQKNVYSDQQFSRDTIEKIGKQEKEVKVMVDGAYYSEDISNLASAYNIDLIPTSLVGKTQSKEKGCYTGFNIDEKAHEVINCPAGIKPEKSSYKNGVYKAHFNKELCTCCPHRTKCPIVEQKKKYFFSVSEKKLHRSKLIERMGEKEYIELAKKRAGIEGIPSVLRRRYDIDNLPVRGLLRVKMYMGFKISAINCKRLIKVMSEKQKSPSIHAITINLLEVLSFQRSSLHNFARA